MLKFFANAALLALFGILAGCTADWDPARQARLGAATHHPQALNGALRSGATMLSAGARSSGFAALPDRGELAVYDPGAKPRVSGAYSAYPVHLSEEHALKAAHAGGHMVIRAPDGKTIMLAYERHVEHPDGNWTWIGRDAQGADAVITFGEQAAFGTIPQVDEESLRLTMTAGQTWLVATDRSKLPDTDRALTRAGENDYLIPPKMAMGAALNGAPMVASPQATSVAIAPAATTTVDVVLGYSTGLAADLGGDSQAVTRLNNLIEIGNQAYANSGINATLRLVGTISVEYGDASDNRIALEDLTGYRAGGPITPHAAFAGLRAARDTYGADLVSFVRDFRAPQNNGCGIAWLIGGNQTGIEQGDAPFGYSVVSDGSDIDEGDGTPYICREESLVHELGHNMGQAHNIDDSDGTSGVHAYSYGYREVSSNGFYTVMAYRLSGSNQFAIRHFANPSVSYEGRPTGVANQSDNARSMNQTIPVVATFRANIDQAHGHLPRSADMNGDGLSDLLWTSQGTLCIWYMNGAQRVGSSCPASAGAGYEIVAIGDFNGDHRDDLIWSNGSIVQGWLNNQSGGFSITPVLTTISGGWAPQDAADMNKDGRADLLWANQGTLCIWYMNGLSIQSTACPDTAGAGFKISAIGDFNGDHASDLIWSNGATLQAWLNSGSGTFSKITNFAALTGDGWEPKATIDVNGDAKSDILWSNQGTLCVWYMNGLSLSSIACPGTAGAGFRIAGVGYYDNNPVGDLVWSNGANIKIWLNSWSGFFWVYGDPADYGSWKPH